ncbi:polymer-forming cytoskeletal protein [bacterium]|nr:polymer-forming cytoskeletal protein [bacterium]
MFKSIKGFFVSEAKGEKKKKVDAVLGENSYFKGFLSFEGIVRVDGRFDGEIKSEGDIIIGQRGRLKANLAASNIVIGGKLHGNITAYQRLELQSGAEVVGDIRTRSLVSTEGVVLKGNCLVDQGLDSTTLSSSKMEEKQLSPLKRLPRAV